MDSTLSQLLDDFELNKQLFINSKIYTFDILFKYLKGSKILREAAMKTLDINDIHVQAFKDHHESNINDESIEPQAGIQSNIIYTLLVKPAQSGKTREMIKDIKSKAVDKDAFFIMICDNSLIQTNQTTVRIDNCVVNDDEKINACEISSNPNSKFKNEMSFIKHYRSQPYSHNCLVMCGNSCRFGNICILLKALAKRKIYIYIDEADKIIGSTGNVDFIKELVDVYDNIMGVCLSTATPYETDKNNLFVKYGSMKLMHQEALSNEYKFLNDFTHEIIEYEAFDNNVKYAFRYLNNNRLNPGEHVFIPCEWKNKTHTEMLKMLLEEDHADIVLIINSKDKSFHFKDGRIIPMDTVCEKKCENKDILQHFMKKYAQPNDRLAVIGNGCVNRGASFQTRDFCFKKVIFGPNSSSSPTDAYQLLFRMGSYVAKDIEQIIICDIKTKKAIEEVEELTCELQKKSQQPNKILSKNEGLYTAELIFKRSTLNDYIFCGQQYPFKDVCPFDTFEKALKIIHESVSNYCPKERVRDSDGYYLAADKSKNMVRLSWDEAKQMINYGMGTDSKPRLRPCYLDVNDKNTLRWVTSTKKIKN